MSQSIFATRWIRLLPPILTGRNLFDGLNLFDGDECIGQESEEPRSANWQYELSVKYAETRMQLADVELRHGLAMNRKILGAVPQFTIERLRSNLAVAKEQYDAAVATSIGGAERVQLRNAEEKIRLAKIDLDTGQKLRKENLISDLELERLKLKHELAKLNVVVIKNPDSFTTLLHYIEAKVDRMGDEILSLDQRITRLEPSRGMLPKNQ